MAVARGPKLWDVGIERGIERGRLMGRLEVQLEARFGRLEPRHTPAIGAADLEALRAWAEGVWQAEGADALLFAGAPPSAGEAQ